MKAGLMLAVLAFADRRSMGIPTHNQRRQSPGSLTLFEDPAGSNDFE